MEAVLVGSVDRRLQELLQAHGMRVLSLALVELPVLAERTTEQPDLVVLDVRSTGSIPAALAALKRNHPSTPVLIAAARLDPALMLDAMRAGVNECVVDPLSANDLAAALARVLAQGPSGELAQVVAVVGSKGGIGTTTIAANVAAALGQLRAGRALLLDLHLRCGDAALALGVEPRFSVIDAIENSHRLDESLFRGFVVRTPSGADLLAGGNRLAPPHLDPSRLRALVEFASRLYEYVVLDVSLAEPGHLDALEAANTILLVTTQEVAALRAVRLQADTLSSRYGAERLRLLVNRHDEDVEIGLSDIEHAVGLKAQLVLPSVYRAVVRSLNTGRPIVIDGDRKVSAAFSEVARVLVGLPPQAPRSERAGFFSRFTSRRAAATAAGVA